MSDDGEEVVTDEAHPKEATAEVETASTAAADTGEDAAESFLDLESELTNIDGDRVRGRAIDVERIPAETVPADYPVTITTPQALALTLELRTGEETRVYFEFEDGTPEDRLVRLLDRHGIEPERFADLYGESLLLTVEGSHHVPYVPPDGPEGSSLGVYGVGAGLGVNLLVFALAVAGLGNLLSVPVVIGWLLVNLVGLPIATYLDARHLLTHTDWEQGPGFWAALAALPGVNVVSSLVYLQTRRGSTEL